MEYTIPLPFVDSNYFLWVDTSIAALDAGILVGWNLYGSLLGSNGTAPNTAADPSWVLLDTESSVDFSVTQNAFLPSLFAFNVSSQGVAYPYFGFVYSRCRLLLLLSQTAPLLPFLFFQQKQIDFCEMF